MPRNVVYLLLCAVLMVTAALMVGQYFADLYGVSGIAVGFAARSVL